MGALALVAAPEQARASGLDVPHIGTTFSSPTTNDAAALYWNPAMIGFAERGEVLLGAGVVGGNIGYQRDRLGTYQTEDSLQFAEPIDPAYIDPSKTGAYPKVNSPIVAPNAGGFISIPILKDRLAAGVGVYVPYAAPLKFADDGPQRFALQQAFIAVSRVSAGLAVKVHERVSLGASISYVLGTAQLRRVQDFAAVDIFGQALENPPINQPNDFGADAPSTVRELSVLARPLALTNAISHGVTFNVALAANPIDPLWIGLTYDHGSQANFRGDFQLNMDDEFFTQDLAAKGLAFPPLVEGTATLSFRLPKRIMLGLAYDISDRIRVDGNFAYVFWSDLDAFRIELDSPDLELPDIGLPRVSQVTLDRSWKGTVHAEFSVRARVGKKKRARLSGTLGYHSGASPDSTIDVASPDGNRLLGAVGVGYQVKDRITLYADGEIQGILPRTVTDSDYDLGNGTYNLVLGVVMLHIEVKFGKGGKLTKKQRAAQAQAGAGEGAGQAEGEGEVEAKPDPSPAPEPESPAGGEGSSAAPPPPAAPPE